MSTGKTTLALLLSALLPAGAARPQAMTLWSTAQKPLGVLQSARIASSGPSFVASSQVLYNRLVSFDPVKNTPIRRWPPVARL